MKALKIGMVLCVIISCIGLIGIGGTIGKMSKYAQFTYEKEMEMNFAETVKEVHIESNVPVKIASTKGLPRVTFESEINGIMFREPSCQFEVVEENDEVYITAMSNDKYVAGLTLGYDEELVVFLPEKMLDVVSVANGWGNDTVMKGKYDIKELKISSLNNKIDIEGEFETIDIQSDWQSDIEIKTNKAADVNIVSNSGKIKLEGAYSNVYIEGVYGGNIFVDSETVYDIVIEDVEADVELRGAIKQADVSTRYSEVKIMPTIESKSLKIESLYGDNVNITLPKSIKGFIGVYKHTENEPMIYSNVDLKTQALGGNKTYMEYGDGSMSIEVDLTYCELSIIQ
ncbi:MAG: hypothetical protein ACRCSG_09350 [Cellulosilyticaceae bacterium]